MTEVIMPKMGDGMEEGTLLEWLKGEGESVKSGEVIGTIQTDKATLELESPGSGKLSGILLQPGQTVPVGVPIALLLKEGESVPSSWGDGKSAPPPTAAPVEEPATTPAASVAATVPTQDSGSERVKASPLARNIAKDLGVDLTKVTGTGPGGRIVERDVRTAPAPPVVAAPQVVANTEDQIVPLNRLRQIIAQRTTQSKQQVPHFYVTVEVDVEAIFALRDQFKAEESGSISVNDFVVKACAKALQTMPEVNAVFQDSTVTQFGSVHIGVAAAVDDGLLVPVIKNAHALSLAQIATESKRLVQKARDGKLTPDEMGGSTFSISNMGMLDVDNFIAIINQPNSAILAIASARRKPVVINEDELEIRWRMNITCSFDHRVVDGAVGARFINVVKEFLENPTRLLL